MNNTEYYTTEHFMNIEKNMSDIIFDLIYLPKLIRKLL